MWRLACGAAVGAEEKSDEAADEMCWVGSWNAGGEKEGCKLSGMRLRHNGIQLCVLYGWRTGNGTWLVSLRADVSESRTGDDSSLIKC